MVPSLLPLSLLILVAVPAVHSWQFMGVWQSADPSPVCAMCLRPDPFTEGCFCNPSTSSTLELRVLNDCPGSGDLHGGNVGICYTNDRTYFDGFFGGVFQLDDPYWYNGCRFPNPATGACNCPVGFEEIGFRALVDTIAEGPIIGSSVVACYNPLQQASMSASWFGGGYQVLDNGRCAVKNPITDNCSCTPDFAAHPIRAIFDGPEGSTIYVCTPAQGPPPPTPPGSVEQPVSVYVSTTGNDEANNGSFSFPFATVSRALEYAATQRSSRNVSIQLFDGVYPQAATLEWNGTACGDVNQGTYVSISAVRGAAGNAVISGAALAPNFTFVRATANAKLYQSNFMDLLGGRFVWQLWRESGGSGFARIPLSARPTQQYNNMESSTPPIQITIPPDQAPPANTTSGDWAFVVLYHDWTMSTSAFQSFVAATNVVTIQGSVPDNIYNGASGNRYRFVNLPELEAMEPWSFYFNASSGDVILAAPLETPSVIHKNMDNGLPAIYVPLLATVLRIQDGCTNAILGPGLTIAHTDSFLAEQCLSYGCSGQSGTTLSTAALELSASPAVCTDNVFQISVTNVSVAHCGGYAVWVHQGSNSVAFDHVHVFDLGAGGVRIGEPQSGTIGNRALLASNVRVTNSRIHDGGYIVEAGTGILLQQAASCVLEHNDIHALYYTAISTGWTWGYAATSNNNLVVRFNRLHNLGRGVLSDMGCVYNLGISPGTWIDSNLCFDMQSYGYGGWGLYSDEGTSYLRWTNNVVYRTKAAPYHQHYGQYNIVENNVFAFPQVFLGQPYPTPNSDFAGVRSSPSPSGPESVTSFSLVRNIVLLRNATATLFFSTIPAAFINVSANSNVYFNTELPVTSLTFPCFVGPNIGACPFSEWQSLDRDVNSTLRDPQFPLADMYNFSVLAPTSPALALGFVPILCTYGPQ